MSSTHPPTLPAPADERDADAARVPDSVEVDAALVDNVLATLRGLQWPSLITAVVFSALLWRQRGGPWPLIWGAIAMAAELAWMALLRFHARQVMQGSAAERAHFGRRLRWPWALYGALWGCSVLIFAGSQGASAALMVSWLILVCIGALSIAALAPHRPSLMAYINSFAGALVVSYAVVLALLPQVAWINGLMLVLLLVYWFALVHIGRTQHEVFLRAMTLQHRNALLIDSLQARSADLQQALDARRRFLAVATHDIRQPVHALRLYADMLQQDPGQVDDLAPRIVKSSAAVNSLFDNLFDLALLDWGRLHPVPQPVCLHELLTDMEVQARPAMHDKGLRLRLRTSRALQCARVTTDRVMMQRILGNLVANAIRYTDQGGVLLALRGTLSAPRLEVWDTGAGIAPHEQAQVFQEFFKSGQHTGTQDGFGLGLTVVQQLARQTGCSVSVRSQFGRGSVLRIALPPASVHSGCAPG